VKGFRYGLASFFESDSAVTFITGDTLASQNTIRSMQEPSFRDAVMAQCNRFDAHMLIALDSMDIWFDWETFAEEDPDGSMSRTKEFYLYSDNYLTFYSSDGEVIDRSTAQESMLFRSRPALSD